MGLDHYPVHYWLPRTGPNLSSPIPVPPCPARYGHILSRTHCVLFWTIPLRSPMVRVPYRSRLDSVNMVPYGPARPPVQSMLTLSGPNVTQPNPGPTLSRRFYDRHCPCASVTKLASPIRMEFRALMVRALSRSHPIHAQLGRQRQGILYLLGMLSTSTCNGAQYYDIQASLTVIEV